MKLFFVLAVLLVATFEVESRHRVSAQPRYRVVVKNAGSCSNISVDLNLICSTAQPGNKEKITWSRTRLIDLVEGSSKLNIVEGTRLDKKKTHEGAHGLVWVDASKENHTSIADKVEAGRETTGEKLYICRTADPKDNLKNGLHTGKFSPSSGTCTAWGASIDLILSAHYQILVNPGNNIKLKWIPATHTVPHGAVYGGHMAASDQYYVGRVKVGRSVQPGQIYRKTLYYYLGPKKAPVWPAYKIQNHKMDLKSARTFEALVAVIPTPRG